MGFNVMDLLISEGNPDPGVVKDKEDTLKKAREIGEKLASE